MREINFRGRSYGGRWIYGYLIKTEQDYQIWQESNVPYPVNPDTVGQFTGLFDKNGKEIYEGDIVNWVNDKGRQVGEVVWTPARFYVRNEYSWFVEIDLTEVIGNIYENSDLLKEVKKK